MVIVETLEASPAEKPERARRGPTVEQAGFDSS
jgi:hypothetical protein